MFASFSSAQRPCLVPALGLAILGLSPRLDAAPAPRACHEAEEMLHALTGPGAGTPWRIRDAEDLPVFIAPDCLQGIRKGQWPALAGTLIPLARYRGRFSGLCGIAPPEAMPVLAELDSEGAIPLADEIACGTAVFRYGRREFDRLILPRFLSADGQAASILMGRIINLGSGLHPGERTTLLPVLERATRARWERRDELYRVLCADRPENSAPACAGPPELEPAWAREARRHAAAPAWRSHILMLLLYAGAAIFAGWKARAPWMGSILAALGTAAVCAAATWCLMSQPSPGAGALNALGPVWAGVFTPFALAFGALAGWLGVRFLRIPRLPWCLMQAALYLWLVHSLLRL